jgi:hypothetical protein
MNTVLDALSYQVKMNDYWWTLAKILVADRFMGGMYQFPSGVVVFDRDPHLFVEEEQKTFGLALQSLQTREKAVKTRIMVEKYETELRKMETTINTLRAAAESKEKERDKLARTESVARTREKALKMKALRLMKQSSGELRIYCQMIDNKDSYGPSVPSGSSPSPSQQLPDSPSTPSVVPAMLPRRDPAESWSTPVPSRLDIDDEQWTQEKEILQSILRVHRIREYVGEERLGGFQSFLEQVLQEDVLSIVCDGKVNLRSLLPGSAGETQPKPAVPPAKANVIDLSAIFEDEEGEGEEDGGDEQDEPDGEDAVDDEAVDEGMEEDLDRLSLEPNKGPPSCLRKRKNVNSGSGPSKKLRRA